MVMPKKHVVWDWNGTLLADLPFVVEAVSHSIARYGVGPIDEDGYRDHFTRPVRRFYDSLFRRPVTDMEWLDLNKKFHERYHSTLRAIDLTPDAIRALDRVDHLGWGQSLLSMSTHDSLVATLQDRRLHDRFARVTGLREADGGLKAIHLKGHLAALDLDPSLVTLIGDTPDDHAAATSVGASIVLYDGGSHHRPVLDALGAPVAGSLLDAVKIIESGF